jgi:hypothetical protein
MGISAKMMAEDMERPDRVTECPCNLLGRPVFDEVGPKGLILTLPGVAGLEEEAADIA